jgi:hypothetical protein
VGPTYVVLGKTRIELHEEQSAGAFNIGYSAIGYSAAEVAVTTEAAQADSVRP